MAPKRIAFIIAVIAILHFLLAVGPSLVGGALAAAGLNSAFLVHFDKLSGVLLQPLASLWEPSADFPLGLGLLIAFANSLAWGVVIALAVVVGYRIRSQKRAAF